MKFAGAEYKIQISPYILKSNYAQLNSAQTLAAKNIEKNSVLASSDRQGALVKITSADGSWGVSDLHAWPDWDGFTQQQLQTMIQELPEERWGETLKNTLRRAVKDLEYRKKNISCWNEIPRPMAAKQKVRVKNNYLVVESIAKIPEIELEGRLRQAEEMGFDIIKLKMGYNLKAEKEMLFELMKQFPHFLWRLDFNSSCKSDEAKDYFADWTRDQIRCVEYVEDPCAFDILSWQQMNQMIPLAFDKPKFTSVDGTDAALFLDPMQLPVFSGTSCFKYVVLKPAHQNLDPWISWCKEKKLRVSITSSMDHPVGIAHSLLNYLEVQKKFPQLLTIAGLRSSFAFEKNNFSTEFEDESPFLFSPLGTGIGFDQQLKDLKWIDYN